MDYIACCLSLVCSFCLMGLHFSISLICFLSKDFSIFTFFPQSYTLSLYFLSCLMCWWAGHKLPYRREECLFFSCSMGFSGYLVVNHTSLVPEPMTLSNSYCYCCCCVLLLKSYLPPPDAEDKMSGVVVV